MHHILYKTSWYFQKYMEKILMHMIKGSPAWRWKLWLLKNDVPDQTISWHRLIIFFFPFFTVIAMPKVNYFTASFCIWNSRFYRIHEANSINLNSYHASKANINWLRSLLNPLDKFFRGLVLRSKVIKTVTNDINQGAPVCKFMKRNYNYIIVEKKNEKWYDHVFDNVRDEGHWDIKNTV